MVDLYVDLRPAINAAQGTDPMAVCIMLKITDPAINGNLDAKCQGFSPDSGNDTCY
jgi:hypothetical protein